MWGFTSGVQHGRREFLRCGALVAAGAALAGCGSNRSAPPGARPGSTVWTYEPSGWFRGVRFARDTVLVVTLEHLIGLDAATGKRRWQQPALTAGTSDDIAVHAGVAYVCGNRDEVGAAQTVRAIDLRSGVVNWTFDAPAETVLNGAYGVLGGALHLVVYNQRRTRREIWALDLDTKQLRWQVDALGDGGGSAVHVPGAGNLVYNYAGGDVVALRTDRGGVAWSSRRADSGMRTTLGSGLIAGAVVVYEGTTVTGLDPRTGAPSWTVPALPQGASPVADLGGGDVYYVCDKRQLSALRPGNTVSPLWSSPVSATSDAVNPGGLATPDTVFFADNAVLRAIDAKNGNQRWTHALAQHSTGSDIRMAAGAGLCYFNADDFLTHPVVTAVVV
ncbi:MAG: PQQ-binding-like beta-propeller repeat protein [Mycobacteriaceae bacterium]|nr:PQQ-binding-like beta-propeller repeat protein [Mycobacteriaceae bacterium]